MRRALDGLLQSATEHSLHLRRPAEKELHRGGKHLQPHCAALLLEKALDHGLEQVWRVLDEQSILAEDPENRALALWLGDDPHATLHCAGGTLELVGILPDEVLHADRRFCANIVDVKLQQGGQRTDDELGGRRHSDRNLADGPDRATRDFGVDVRHVLAELADDCFGGVVVPEQGEDVDLDRLDVRWVVVPAEELLEVGNENLHVHRSPGDKRMDVHKHRVRELRRRRGD
mmetsp:Transcript_96523/g.278599  ORF Transcript_96523/g.278599 Transcript_96523/m.278599 type:complete len:231 (+) Transcript_96523:1070-1762(+)